MAHSPVHTCSPPSIYGPYNQTLFLGCSVISFTANAGINEQSSELTIELVQDPCITPKTYIDTTATPESWPDLSPKTANMADPGFGLDRDGGYGTPVFGKNPMVGSPCYFRVQNFEYAGILQSWTKKLDQAGMPVYSVKLTDPSALLDNLKIIVGEYQGPIKGIKSYSDWDRGVGMPSFPDQILSNIVNVYGFLDSLRENCPLIGVDGVDFGAPAGGFGTSSQNDAGIPWNLVRASLEVLLGRADGSINAEKYSKGYVYGPPGGNGGYGEIYTGGTPYHADALPAKYILDLTEIPFAPPHYRISGPIISASELISQVCADAGCDYYVELVPTGGALVIKVRVIVRTNQAAMGEINSFIATASTTVGISNSTIGKEWRNDPNNSFIIGDKTQSLYRHSGIGTPSGDGSHGHVGSGRTIQPYWGRDMDGQLNPAYESDAESIYRPGGPNTPWKGPPDWNVRLDLHEIQGMLNTSFADMPIIVTKMGPHSKAWIWEGEIRACLGTFNDFMNFMMQQDPYPFKEAPPNVIDITNDTFLRTYFKELEMTQQAMPGTPMSYTLMGELRALGGAKIAANLPQGAGSEAMEDAQTVYKWLQGWAQEHYGRKWLVEIPFACYSGDTGNPNLIEWSDQPSPEGAWSDSYDILELENHETRGFSLDRFKTADGRITPILRWTQSFPDLTRNPTMTGLDYSELNSADFITNTFNEVAALQGDLYVWQKAEIDEHWVTGSPYSGSEQNRVFALLTCEPVYTGFGLDKGKRELGYFSVQSGMRDTVLPTGDGTGKMPTRLFHQAGGAYSSRMICPQAAAVPVLSNTQTYGPWYKETLEYGSYHTEHDETLNPWSYGGTRTMELAALNKLDNSTTKMNFAERGEVTLAGYPEKGLGAGITSTLKVYSGRILTNDTWFGFDYHYVPLAKSTAGASVSNINVTVSPQGVTTSYSMSTFTPVFGRFSKGNAERLGQIGRNRLRANRTARKARAKSELKAMTPKGRAHTLLSRLTAGPAWSPNSPGILLAGRVVGAHRSDPGLYGHMYKKRKEVIVADKNSLVFYDSYEDTAMMSLDGLLRPVATSGAATIWPNAHPLPIMKNYRTVSCPSTGEAVAGGAVPSLTSGSSGGPYTGFPTGQTSFSNNIGQISPPPPLPQMSGLVISSNYLDPLADWFNNPNFVSGARATGSLGTGQVVSGKGSIGGVTYASGHDIEAVARTTFNGLGQLTGLGGIDGESMLICGESGRYSGVGESGYRFMALRGPLVLQGWGYDTYGKPIPNAAGYSTDISSGTIADSGSSHRRDQSGLTDRFAPDWLSNSTNWPVGPVDLRFDRARGVWTSPPPFRLMKAQAVEEIAAGESGIFEMLTAGDMYNEDGKTWGEISTTGSGAGQSGETGTGVPPIVLVKNDGGDLVAGDKRVLYYDTFSCEYWILGGGGSGGGGCEGGVTASVTIVESFECVGDIISGTTTTLNFVDGCLVG